jgi:hypothetical protein
MIKLLSVLAATLVAASSVPVADASHSTSGSRSRLSSAAQREVRRLSNLDELEAFPVPILFGVAPNQVNDTWGDARSNGRTHEGTDIFARRGAYIVAPSDSVVTSIGYGANGGNFVYTTNPGGERFYFAHLEDYRDGLKVGDILKKGDLIGYVGDSGNAQGTSPHLHLGIYERGAENPYPRMTEEFTIDERISAVERILEDADDADAEARVLVGDQPTFFRQAKAAGEDLPDEIVEALARTVAPAPSTGGGASGSTGIRDLTLGASGADVTKLQATLIAQKKGSAATALAAAGATGYFGALTQKALAEYQAAVGISPASGYYGPLTRAHMVQLALL